MKNKTLVNTNLLVCIIIIIGFAATSFISYRSNMGIYEQDVERVSTLTSEGMYNEITNIFAQPVSVSLTMANDSLLKSFLADESHNMMDASYLAEMQQYLNGYREKYVYDSVFLVSTETNRYYHFNGIDRVLTQGDPENIWYYSFLAGDEEYSLNVDNDQADKNSITVFVNCKIKGQDGAVVGVVGVGLKVDTLQKLLRRYEERYDIQTYLVDNTGVIEISPENTGYENVNLFDTVKYTEHKTDILENRETRQTFWYTEGTESGYVVTRYEPNLKWHLVVENDTTMVSQQLHWQLYRNLLIIFVIILLVLVTITIVIKKYHEQIIKLTISQEMEYQKLLHETTKELYENISEFDITHNCIVGVNTAQYFESLGIRTNTSYDKALAIIAKKQIKTEYQKGYLDTFQSEHILETYNSGINHIVYDFLISDDAHLYHWVRVTARIFFWNSDHSVRMISYRKNIDEEKRRELKLIDEVQRDAMTGIYNKTATETLIGKLLETEKDPEAKHAFLILDIDNFKTVNDTMGHAFGDHVICELVNEIKIQFCEQDIVGRVGGDEFAIFMRNIGTLESVKQKLDRICIRLSSKDFGEGQSYYISCSIGMSQFRKDGTGYAELYEKADQALYYTKRHGKASFSVFGENEMNKAYQASRRDLEALLNSATDGITKFACTTPLTVLDFNEKFMELTGRSAKELSVPGFDPIQMIHPEDHSAFDVAYEAIRNGRDFFAMEFRIRKADGSDHPVSVKGIFTGELYEGDYPVFCAIYNKRTN